MTRVRVAVLIAFSLLGLFVFTACDDEHGFVELSLTKKSSPSTPEYSVTRENGVVLNMNTSIVGTTLWGNNSLDRYRYEYRVDGGSWIIDSVWFTSNTKRQFTISSASYITAGTHTIEGRITAQDLSGYTVIKTSTYQPLSISITFDRTSPSYPNLVSGPGVGTTPSAVGGNNLNSPVWSFDWGEDNVQKTGNYAGVYCFITKDDAAWTKVRQTGWDCGGTLPSGPTTGVQTPAVWSGGGDTSLDGDLSDLPQGDYLLHVMQMDAAGNAGIDGSGWRVHPFKIHRDPPTASTVCSPLNPNGQNGWYTAKPDCSSSVEDAIALPSSISLFHNESSEQFCCTQVTSDGPSVITASLGSSGGQVNAPFVEGTNRLRLTGQSRLGINSQMLPEPNWSSAGSSLKKDFSNFSGGWSSNTKTISSNGSVRFQGNLQYQENQTLQKVFSRGRNNLGQLGLGSGLTQNGSTFVGDGLAWDKISAGGNHSLAISNGDLYAWGLNTSGQLGTGNTTDGFVPVKISSGGWTDIAAGGYHSVGIRNGQLYAWGKDSNGQVGNGSTSTSNVLSPALIDSNSDWTDIAAGDAHSFGIRSNNLLYGWGSDDDGQIGNGSDNQPTSPSRTGGDAQASTGWTDISAGYDHSLGLKSGSLYGWGKDDKGQLGNGAGGPSSLPSGPIGSGNWSSLTAGNKFSAAINNGQIYTWGSDDDGQLCNGTPTGNQTSPQRQDANSTGWSRVSAGYWNIVAIRNGGVYGCGNNSYNQINSSSSTKIESLVTLSSPLNTGVTDVSAGGFHVLAEVSGSISNWGRARIGQAAERVKGGKSYVLSAKLASIDALDAGNIKLEIDWYNGSSFLSTSSSSAIEPNNSAETFRFWTISPQNATKGEAYVTFRSGVLGGWIDYQLADYDLYPGIEFKLDTVKPDTQVKCEDASGNEVAGGTYLKNGPAKCWATVEDSTSKPSAGSWSFAPTGGASSAQTGDIPAASGSSTTTSSPKVSVPGENTSYTFSATGNDNAGWSDNKSATVTIDTIDPTVNIDCGSPNAYGWRSSDASCEVTYQEANLQRLEYQIWEGDGEPAESTTWNSAPDPNANNKRIVSVEAEGLRSLRPKATDKATRSTTASKTTVRIDKTEPAASVSCTKTGSRIQSSGWATSASCTPTATDAISGIQSASYKKDASTWKTIEDRASWQNTAEYKSANSSFALDDGVYDGFQIKAKDFAGNEKTSTASTEQIKVDSNPPIFAGTCKNEDEGQLTTVSCNTSAPVSKMQINFSAIDPLPGEQTDGSASGKTSGWDSSSSSDLKCWLKENGVTPDTPTTGSACLGLEITKDSQSIVYQFSDRAGNWNTNQQQQQIEINPNIDDGNPDLIASGSVGDWSKTVPSLQVRAFDPSTTTRSDIKKITVTTVFPGASSYNRTETINCSGGASSCAEISASYSPPIPAGGGYAEVSFQAVDVAGRRSETSTIPVRVDSIAPVGVSATTLTAADTGGSSITGGKLLGEINLKASLQKNGSGLEDPNLPTGQSGSGTSSEYFQVAYGSASCPAEGCETINQSVYYNFFSASINTQICDGGSLDCYIETDFLKSGNAFFRAVVKDKAGNIIYGAWNDGPGGQGYSGGTCSL